MKLNQKGRFNRQTNNRSIKPVMITRNTSLESSGPFGKLHGTALQLADKYNAYAKDALLHHDHILAENCLQYADHYMRLQNQAIANEANMYAKSSKPAEESEEMPNSVAPETSENTEEKVQVKKNTKKIKIKRDVPVINEPDIMEDSIPY